MDNKVVVAAVVVVGALLYFSWSKSKKEKKALELEAGDLAYDKRKTECHKKAATMRFGQAGGLSLFLKNCIGDKYSSADCGCGA